MSAEGRRRLRFIAAALADPEPVVGRYHEIAAVLADMPDTVTVLLGAHVADDRGLCRACTRPGTGLPHQPAPCTLWRVAETARSIRARPDRR